MPRVKGEASSIALNMIIDKINNYELSSGQIVSDLELSKELNISRTPVREAIERLIDFGMLERTSTKVVVKPITSNDIVEIFQVREAIETISIRIIFDNGGLSQTQEQGLINIHRRLCDDISGGDFDKNFSDDTVFHKKLIEYSNNTRLVDIYERINLQSQRLRWMTLLTPARYAGTRDEHQLIVDGILKNDMQSSTQAIRSHLYNSLQNYTQILSNNQWSKVINELKNMRT